MSSDPGYGGGAWQGADSRGSPPPGPAQQMGVSATPGGPLLSFDTVPPCPAAPRKSRPPPGHFDRSDDAPVRRLDFADEARAHQQRRQQQQQELEQQLRQQRHGSPPLRPPHLHIPEDAVAAAAAAAVQQQQQQQQSQQQGRGAPAPHGESLFGSPLGDESRAGGGPVPGRHQRPAPQRPHPYHQPPNAQGTAAALGAADLVSPTAAGPFASPQVAKPKRAPATPVRLFR